MNIVKENEGIGTQFAEMSQEQYFKALVDDYQKGEVILKKVKTYNGAKAKPGHVFYRMKYKKNGEYIYNGNFEFKKTIEAKYLEKGKLTNYLLYHLSVELSKF